MALGNLYTEAVKTSAASKRMQQRSWARGQGEGGSSGTPVSAPAGRPTAAQAAYAPTAFHRTGVSPLETVRSIKRPSHRRKSGGVFLGVFWGAFFCLFNDVAADQRHLRVQS